MNDIIYTVGQRISRFAELSIVRNFYNRALCGRLFSPISNCAWHKTEFEYVSASINSGVISIVHMSCLSGRLSKTTTYHINCNLQLMKSKVGPVF